jgi:hypothetical protein
MAETFSMVATAVTATSTVTLIDSGFAAINVVRALNVYNAHTSNTAAVTIAITRITTATEYTLAAFSQVTCQETIQALPQPLVLNANDTLRVRCNPVDSVHVVASYLKIE